MTHTGPMLSSPATWPRRPDGCCWTCAHPSARWTTRTPPTPCASRPTRPRTCGSWSCSPPPVPMTPSSARRARTTPPGSTPTGCGSWIRSTAPTSTARVAPTSPSTSRCGSRPARSCRRARSTCPAQGLTRSVLDEVAAPAGLPVDRPIRIVASRSRPPATLGADGRATRRPPGRGGRRPSGRRGHRRRVRRRQGQRDPAGPSRRLRPRHRLLRVGRRGALRGRQPLRAGAVARRRLRR